MNLHSFSRRGSCVCRSLFLRTFMMMMLFITGSNGIYAGDDLTTELSHPSIQGNGSWDSSKNVYTWSDGSYNLMTIFTGLEGKLGKDYVALKFTTSNYTNSYRVLFMDGDVKVAQIDFWKGGKKYLDFSNRNELKGKDLSKVDNIKFGGNSGGGSITLDPKSIVLVGQLQNNTQRYDFSTFKEITNVGNVQSAVYNNTEDALVVTTERLYNNYFPLYNGLTGTKRTGVRVTAKGVKFRIIAKTSDEKIFQYSVPASDGYVTSHYKWEDFVQRFSTNKMTKADVEKINEIGLAGDNDDANATNMVFYVSGFWLDDIADYNKTIPCYGYEGGRKDEANKSFVYTIDGATAVFEGNNDDRDANQNIMLKAGKNLKLSLSSAVSKFTEVCLVFGDKKRIISQLQESNTQEQALH